jgi:hypothetical protein
VRSICAAIALLLGCSAEHPVKGSPSGDAAADARADVHADVAADAEDAIVDGTVTDTSTLPPPVEDAAEPDYGVAPGPDTHVEATLGPSGGRLAGAPGTSLANVALDVPAGALAGDTLLALDLDGAPALPGGAKAASAYVRVGPDGLSFAVPARLTLPCLAPAAASSLGGLARVGASWASLLSPSYEPITRLLTVSMSRASGAIAATLPSAPSPTITGFSPSTAATGAIVFLDGSGFGLAPSLLIDGDAGVARAAEVAIGGAPATVTGWSDGAISFRVPVGATSGTITVKTTTGQSTSASALLVP